MPDTTSTPVPLQSHSIPSRGEDSRERQQCLSLHPHPYPPALSCTAEAKLSSSAPVLPREPSVFHCWMSLWAKMVGKPWLGPSPEAVAAARQETATSPGADVKTEQPIWVFPLPVSCFLSLLPFPFPLVLSASSDHSNPICSCVCSADCVLNFYQRQTVSQQVFMSKNRAIHSVTVVMTLRKMTLQWLF